MINGKSILAIIPARGGSKGLPKKNIKNLVGKPLIAWTIEEAKKSKYIDRLILSSEDKDIISVAEKFGCEVPFIRPANLSLDSTPGIDPVIHAIENIEVQYDYICLLQPTSPLRTVYNIDSCIKNCINSNGYSCVSVYEADKHPYWMYKVDTDNKLVKFFNENEVARRQDLPKVYSLNGAIYFIKTSELIKNKKFILTDTFAYIMKKENSIDIDNILDFKIAEILIKDRLKNVS